jgi:DNA uptake protein ComE-like DNA-binding protein
MIIIRNLAGFVMEVVMSSYRHLVIVSAVATLLVAGIGHMEFAQAAAAQGQAVTARLNPNTATEAQLRAIPQLSPELVQLILQNRPFATTADYHRVVGSKLNAEQRNQLYAVVFVPIKLNTASEAEIMLIPGMTARMAEEFEEYRPYTSMDQFNREIGKYVNQTELARLASYVSLN